MAEVLGILFLTIVAPIWIIMHYMTVWKRSKTLTGEDEKLLEELYEIGERMEERIETLEKIIASDDRDWRKEAAE